MAAVILRERTDPKEIYGIAIIKGVSQDEAVNAFEKASSELSEQSDEWTMGDLTKKLPWPFELVFSKYEALI